LLIWIVYQIKSKKNCFINVWLLFLIFERADCQKYFSILNTTCRLYNISEGRWFFSSDVSAKGCVILIFKMRNYKKGTKVSFLFKLRGKRRPSFEIKEGIGSSGRGRFWHLVSFSLDTELTRSQEALLLLFISRQLFLSSRLVTAFDIAFVTAFH